MRYKQVLENCYSENIGEHGVSRYDVETMSEDIAQYLLQVQADKMRLFDFSDIEQRADSITKITKDLQSRFEKLYILGTGGSTLCGQAICGLNEKKDKEHKSVFVDNIDPDSFSFMLENFDPKNSFVLVISKSGNTIETITQFIIFLNKFIDSGFESNISDHFMTITTSDESGKNNTIEKIAKEYDIKSIQHENVGGRFSIFSSVGLIPASFGELDVLEFLSGAKNCLEKTYLQADRSPAVMGAALNAVFAENGGASTVIMPYVDRLKNFTNWFSQIWAESLGKTSKAITPIRSLGTLDQHSQLQLFLEGRKDKLYNVITNQTKDRGEKLSISGNENISHGVEFLNDKKAGDVIYAAVHSTTETLKNNGLPVRSFELDRVNEYCFGELSMHFVLETVLLAKYWHLNPFDQPAVEAGKKIALNMLGKK